jgi:hypothetical protein
MCCCSLLSFSFLSLFVLHNVSWPLAYHSSAGLVCLQSLVMATTLEALAIECWLDTELANTDKERRDGW